MFTVDKFQENQLSSSAKENSFRDIKYCRGVIIQNGCCFFFTGFKYWNQSTQYLPAMDFIVNRMKS